MKYYQKPKLGTPEFEEHCGMLYQIEHTISTLRQLHTAIVSGNIPLETIKSANNSAYCSLLTTDRFTYLLGRRINNQQYEGEKPAFSETHPILGRIFTPVTEDSK